MGPADKRKQSLYFPQAMLRDIQDEARRLDRSLSWVMQYAWRAGSPRIKELPSPHGELKNESETNQPGS